MLLLDLLRFIKKGINKNGENIDIPTINTAVIPRSIIFYHYYSIPDTTPNAFLFC
jgi:hypothetical protein